ncbi:MAG: ATP-binding cassette domain-containing protein [Mesorhizobium sp.]|nr:MAG: ATP-binding cassette domain-containing protein [Mesorhizobium sp.]
MNANPIEKTNTGMNDAILQVEHLSMKFGGLVAIGDLSFTARRGEITALIGPNGAGKTTVFNCITGFYKPSEGMITLNRADGSSYLLERLPNHEIPARAKVARTFQNIRLFSGMTLLENLLVAQHNKLMKASGYTVLGLFGFSGYRKASAESVELAKHWLEKADLVDRADDPAGDLPYGAQRRLEIARAMCTGPELLCLDEPAAGLNPKESLALNALLMDIKNTSGTSILLIEHDMSVVMKISDHVVVLEYGRKISDGNPQSVRTDPRVIAAYLGVDDEEVETVLTEVGDEDVIEQLDTGPDSAHGPGTSSSYLAGPVSDTVSHSEGERVTVSKGASKAAQFDARTASVASRPIVAKPAPAAKPAAKTATKKPAAKKTAATKTAETKTMGKAPAAKAEGVSNRLAAPRGGKADDLTLIKGIGTVNEKKLNEHGIFHFDQIGAWKKADVEAVEAYLAFDGRIAREEWVKQAKLLGQGKDTEFSRRVDAGKVATSHASGKAAKAASKTTNVASEKTAKVASKTANAASGKTAAKPAAGKRGGGK